MATALTIINGAHRLLGVTTTTTTQQANGLETLQQMIDEWNARGLRLFSLTSIDKDMSAGQATVTVASGGDINVIPRPNLIWYVAAFNGLSSSVRGAPYLLDELTVRQWTDQYSQVAPLSGPPRCWYYDGKYPSAAINIYPVPSVATTVRVVRYDLLTNPTATGDTVAFPPAYAKALRWNLAVDLSPEYAGSALAADMDRIERRAKEALAIVEQMNARRIRSLECDPELQGRPGTVFDPRSGNYV